MIAKIIRPIGAVPILLALLALLSLGCSKPKLERKDLGINIDSAYMMLTRKVDMLVSDSGQTKYRLTSPLWIIYDRSDRKEWLFPDTLRMWSVDSIKPGHKLITADSAIFYTEREEWVLIGNVRIHGLKGEKLYTQRLHWQRKDQKLFSNDTTYFYTDGKELHGDRFEAKDDLSQYSIYNSRGNFHVVEKPGEDAPLSPASPAPTAAPTAPAPTAPAPSPKP